MHTNSSIDSKSSAKTEIKKPEIKKSGVKTRASAKPAKVSKSDAITAETLHLTSKPLPDIHKIAEAAYYLAEHRSFAPGHELEDWLQAEQQISTAASYRQ